jgi:putative phosphoribosyl transferase
MRGGLPAAAASDWRRVQQRRPDAAVAELGQQRDVDDADLVVSAVDVGGPRCQVGFPHPDTMTLTKFDDLRAGGRALANVLTGCRTDRDALVLGIVRGGVYAAVEVARSLALSLDLVVGRALLQDSSGELLRAVRVAGTLVLDERCAALPAGSRERAFLDDALPGLAAREALCRGTRAPVRIARRTVLLIDNGMRTGQTMAAAIRAVRLMDPGRVVAATPVGAQSAVAHVARLADEVHSVVTPSVLGNVAMAYARFDVPLDSEIATIIGQQ